MQPLSLKTAIATYGHTRALKDGTVAPEGASLDHVEVSPIIAAFRRMVRTAEFDVSEMALSTYLCARAHGKPMTAIPVFPLRGWQHGAIVYNTKSGITAPRDLEGRRVGVRAYTVTGGIWVRGFLHDEHGVDLNKITWVIVDDEHVADYEEPKNVVRAPEGSDLRQMLLAGEIDAAIGAGPVDSPDIKPLIPNAQAAAVESFKRTGVYPINHTVVIKNSVLDAHPAIAQDLFSAFRRSKDLYMAKLDAGTDLAEGDQNMVRLRDVVGKDPIPYGVAANRAALETMIRFNVEQGVIPKAVTAEEMFAPATRDS